MRVWLVTIGEPIPTTADDESRLLRTGYFAHLLSQHGHDVVWWSSAFDHFRKIQLCASDTDLIINEHLTIKLLRGPGYSSHVSMERIWDHWKIYRKFLVAIRRQPDLPDIIVAALPTIDLCYESVLFGNQRGIPVVLDMRDMWPDIFMDLVPGILRPVARQLLRPQFRRAVYACAQASAIIGITDEYVAWGLRRGKRRQRLFDKAFPLGYSVLTITEESEAEAMAELSRRGIRLEENKLYAIYIGSLSRNANLGDILSVSRILSKVNSKWRFLICGDGDCVDLIKRHMSSYPNVLYGGWVNKTLIHVLMRRCHIGLNQLPDRYDFLATINNKAIEYMSAGLPIISSPDHGFLSKFVKAHECGTSYPTGDAEFLAAMLVRFGDDKEALEKMSRNATLVFEERFTAERVYTEMMDHLARIVDSHN